MKMTVLLLGAVSAFTVASPAWATANLIPGSYTFTPNTGLDPTTGAIVPLSSITSGTVQDEFIVDKTPLQTFTAPKINGTIALYPVGTGTYSVDFQFIIPQNGTGTGSITTSSPGVDITSVTFDTTAGYSATIPVLNGEFADTCSGAPRVCFDLPAPGADRSAAPSTLRRQFPSRLRGLRSCWASA